MKILRASLKNVNRDNTNVNIAQPRKFATEGSIKGRSFQLRLHNMPIWP